MQANTPPNARHVADVLLDPERRGRLFAYACSRFGISRQDAEDLLQETAIELLRYRSYVRSPEGFVFAVFRARCTRFASKQALDREMLSANATSAGDAETPGPDSIDRQLALREALDVISSSCRRLLAAYYVEGQSLREAAQRLSLAYSSIGKTLSRCLRRLRECLA